MGVISQAVAVAVEAEAERRGVRPCSFDDGGEIRSQWGTHQDYFLSEHAGLSADALDTGMAFGPNAKRVTPSVVLAYIVGP